MTSPAQTIPVNVHIPGSLGLTDKQVRVLEEKWQKDLSDAASESTPGESLLGIKVHIKIVITIDAHN